LPKVDSATARIDRLPPKPRRVFGALRGVVRVDPSFIDPLPIAELDAWSARSKRRVALSTQEKLAVSLEAFWAISADWRLTPTEQSALLSISKRTLARWKSRSPSGNARTLDRLMLISLTYVRIMDAFGYVLARNGDLLAWYLRLPGTAANPEAPHDSVLIALSERSVLAMLTRYRCLAESLSTSPLRQSR
jgi:hypothetical protein